MEDLRAKRQHLQSFLLRHGRVFSGRRRLDPGAHALALRAALRAPAQHLVLAEYRQAIADAEERLERLTGRSPSWSRPGPWRRWSRPTRPCAASPS
jgi:peptidoglycan/xylan/chitin deacetylase (PgdA/CDA1 family)